MLKRPTLLSRRSLQSDDEFVEAMGSIDLHDVPQDRLAADLYHRFWLDGSLLLETGAETTSKYCDFQRDRPPSQVRPVPKSVLSLDQSCDCCGERQEWAMRAPTFGDLV